MPEEWRPVISYEGLYEVSNLGRVRSFKKSKDPFVMKLCTHYKVYRTIYLYRERGGKDTKHFIHRLVAEAFIPNPLAKPFVNHIDCDKSNNILSNLEWMTELENTQYYFQNRVKEDVEF